MGAAPTAPSPRALNCPHCGAALTLRGMQHSLSVVCIQCLSILDARDPSLQVLQKFQARERIRPLIPLGTRGKWRGDPYEVIGFQVRGISVEGVQYRWAEYLLFNPFQGFRYLTEYQGHWNDVKTLRNLPEPTRSGGKRAMKLLGETYRHFQSAEAETVYVMGEFPWRVQVGERARVEDFIAPPRMLSAEITPQETVWSLGEYVAGSEVWRAFQLPGSAPPAMGSYANQPSPYKGRVGSVWLTCLVLLAGLIALKIFFLGFMRQEEVFSGRYSFSPNERAEASFVTPVFELRGRTSSVELTIHTDLRNNWAYFNFALINDQTGEALDFGREVSYYFGRDSDGAWTEGDARDRVLIPSVPAGRYYLRVEPEMDKAAAGYQRVNYELRLRRDVPSNIFFWIAALLLLAPPLLVSVRAVMFEQARWQESDYAQ